MPCPELSTLAQCLLAQQRTLATAESCTGGLLGSQITDQPGSSAYYLGGVIAYHNRIKMQLLGVPEPLLAAHGAVSAECALAMALGAQRVLAADCALAITGIAGPAGGSPQKPVGLVWLAAVSPTAQRVESHRWQCDRLQHKQYAAQAAVQLLLGLLCDSP